MNVLSGPQTLERSGVPSGILGAGAVEFDWSLISAVSAWPPPSSVSSFCADAAQTIHAQVTARVSERENLMGTSVDLLPARGGRFLGRRANSHHTSICERDRIRIPPCGTILRLVPLHGDRVTGLHHFASPAEATQHVG